MLGLAACLWPGDAPAERTVTLDQREFAETSPAAPFQEFVSATRKRAAATTPVWKTTDGDLAAWGPALIFPLLGSGVPTETIVDLAAPLAAEGSAPLLMFRTLGLYAAKSRVPFADTPTLQQAVQRNLRTIERATRDRETFAGGPGLAGWGSIGARAWLAYLALLYPDYWDLGSDGSDGWGGDGLRIVDQLLVRGRLPEGQGFGRDPRDTELTVWPNALLIYALVKAYEHSASVRYEVEARAVAAALDALRAGDGSYYTTAAREEKDPRANAYLAGALLLLFKDTGEAQYRDRAMAIVRWLTGDAVAPAVAGDAAIGAHIAYLVLLVDSLATRPVDTLLGRRPLRPTHEGADSALPNVAAVAARLRPGDFRYRDMFDAVLETLMRRVPAADGDIAYDHGDGPPHATAVLLAAENAAENPAESPSVVGPFVHRATHFLSWPRLRQLGETVHAADTLLAAADRPTLAPTVDAELRRYLLFSGTLTVVDRSYLDWVTWWAAGGWDAGPTVLGAHVAETHLRFAARFPDQSVGGLIHPLRTGRALLAGADGTVWADARSLYLDGPGAEVVALLPNAAMINALVAAHRLTGSAGYLERAQAVVRGLEVLWDDARGAYVADSAQTGDAAHHALDANRRAAVALLRLSQATAQAQYRERAVRIFDFIRRDLFAGGVIAPHLYRGRRPTGDVWCSGCNWGVLNGLRELAATP